MSVLVDPTQRALTAALNGLAQREQAIAANIANIDTPGYQAVSIDFESQLRDALAAGGLPGASGGSASGGVATAAAGSPLGLQRTDPRHLPGIETANPVTAGMASRDAAIRNDSNGVDLESEVTALAESQLRYAAVSRLLTGKIDMVRSAIGGR